MGVVAVDVRSGDGQCRALRLDVLGPLRASRDDDQVVDLGPAQQQAVLAVLSVQANRMMSRELLIDAVWGPLAPAYAVNLVQKYISNLRRVLEPGRRPRTPSGMLTWQGGSYRLNVPTGCVDLDVFDASVAAARAAHAAGDFAGASRGYTEALSLWRGAAFEGLTAPLLDAERARLEERRIGVVEERVAVDLEVGHDADLVLELRRLVAQHPLRERLRRLLMVALYRCGRQAEALEVFREAHRYLADELGVEPTSELRETHQRILADDPALGRAPEPPADRFPAAAVVVDPLPPPAQLPGATPGFTGREEQLHRLGDLARDAAGGATPVAVITGTAGVGKTTVAIQAGHLISELFPDGQLHVDLRGFHPQKSPLPTAEALRGLLETLGVPVGRIPVGLDQRAALYRSLLAGRRVLVVLDNARDTDQVVPLLPGGGGCMALVTSRRRLSGLLATGAVAVPVALFTPDEAEQMLERRVGRERVTDEPGAVRDIIAASARLPLALAVVAARAAVHPRFPLATLAGELRAAHGGLDGFVAEDAITDARAVLSWSYRSLSPPAARLFRLLGLHPGEDIGLPAVAALAGDAARVREPLAELSVAHLIEERTPGRFAFHDLLRAYAAELAQAPEGAADREAALNRMFDHYLSRARAADRTLYPYRSDSPPAPDGDDAGAAMMWLAGEHANLLAVLELAARSGRPAHVYGIAWSMSAFLNYQGHWHHWADSMQAALDAARRLGDLPAQAQAYRLLNLACIQLGRLDDAERFARSALRLLDALGDPAGAARIHLNLSRVMERQGHPEQALDEARRALELFRRGADWAGEADALSWIGWYHGQLGRPDQALDFCLRSLAVHRSSGDWPGQADTWSGLGYAHHQLGRHDEAVTCYRRALALWQELGDRYEVATTLARLGDSHRGAGDGYATRQAWTRAMEIFEELGHPEAARLRPLLAGAID